MGNCLSGLSNNKDYITEKSLIAVRNVIEYLKEDVVQRDIFRATGHEALAKQISRELHKGRQSLYRLLEEASVRDIASGLLVFLTSLKKPLLPQRIQALVLDPDNAGVAPEVVAQDVLGLINQEVTGRQFVLLIYVLDLLNHVLKYTPTDELSGSNVPICMMPVFFNFQAEHITHWRRVAVIFVEVIRLAPQTLNLVPERFDGNTLVVQNEIEAILLATKYTRDFQAEIFSDTGYKTNE